MSSPQIGWGRNSRENATGLHSRGLFCNVSDAIALEDDKIFCLATPKKKPTHKFNGYLPLLFSRHSELVQKDLLSVMFSKNWLQKVNQQFDIVSLRSRANILQSYAERKSRWNGINPMKKAKYRNLIGRQSERAVIF